jgi:hypothetical protein
MRSYKRRIHSALLNRVAHADIFEVGAAPRFLFVLFGGSGVDEEEYERRSHTVIPVLGPVLERLAAGGMNVVAVYVSAPYDVPFNRFASNPAAAEAWNAHVLTELLEPWSKLPYFASGFSGGAALAFNGLQKDSRCFGGAALGADALPPGFVCPDHWAEKLRLYCAPTTGSATTLPIGGSPTTWKAAARPSSSSCAPARLSSRTMPRRNASVS